MNTKKIHAAIIGSGNIGTDLLIKFHKRNKNIKIVAVAGIDAASKGLEMARQFGAATTAEGVEGLIKSPEFADVKIVFDATSAHAHIHNDQYIRKVNPNIRMIDLTPAAIGPYHIPVASHRDDLNALNLNMVTCGGQATVPIVYAISRVAKVHYAEIVASISSLSAGPGTRANIDEFTVTTSKAIEKIGGATKGKAIIILNPADPPVMMRDTIYTLSEVADQDKIRESIEKIVKEIQDYVPGYRLKQEVQFDIIPKDKPLNIPDLGYLSGLKTTVFIEVEGAADFLPSYAGNLDIMTSSALITAEKIAETLD